ncbi:hypothetical protein LXL04_019347 [Taraxacum kok-saghyz]
MSSSRIRNFRRRSEDDDNEDEDKEKTTTPAATTTISKKQQSKPATATPKPKKPSLLSFADDESTDFITPITRSALLIQLNNLPIIDDSLTNTKEGDEESDRDETMNRLGSIRLGGKIGKGGNLGGGVIPDQAMIDAIRAKRERLRQSRGAALDFIALDGGSNHGEAEGLSDEEPEFQGRIALIGEKGDAKKGVFEDVVDVSNATFRKENVGNDSDDGVEDEEDEEDKMWEEEQFRKGLGKRIDEGVAVRGVNSSTIPTIVQNVQQKVAYPTVPVSSYPSVNNGPSIGGSFGWSRFRYNINTSFAKTSVGSVYIVSRFLLPSSTATTATAAMSSSRKRNFRRRSEDDDKEDEDKEKTTTPAATTTISKKQQSKPATATPKPKKPSLLSFDDDESTDFITPITRSRPSNPIKQPSSFRLSKASPLSSSSAHKLTSAKDRNSAKERTSASSLPSNVQPQVGVYTKEALLELKKNTKTLGSSTSRSRPRPPPCEPIIVLKGMVKPIIDDSLTNTKEGDEESDRDETMNRLGSIRLGGKIGKWGNLDGGVIPDQAMIDAIRAKRERLRQSRAAAPDFKALDGGSNHGEAEGLSDEEPKFQGRIALIGEKGDAKKGVFEDVVDVSNATFRKENVGNDSDDGVEDEEDEEDKMWEEEQFRKGLGKRIDEGVAVRGVSSSTIPTIVQNVQQKVAYPTVPVSSYPSVNNGPSIGGSFGWSRNLAKERTSASSLPSNVQPQAGVYTKEALLKLQKNTNTLGSSTSRSRPRPPPCEPIIVLKCMVKPIIDDSLTNTKEGDEESDRDETMNRLGSIRLGGKIGKGGNLDGGVIQDQAMIDAIREKRERLRQSRAAAPDFIALDGGSNHGEAEGLSDEEPEFQGRIALIGEKGDAKKGVFEDVVDVSNATFRKENVGNDSDDGVEDEEDEEDKMWEEEQFRKGLGKRIDEGVAVRGVSSSTIPTIVQNVQQKVAYPTVPVSSYPSVNNGPSIGGSFGWSRFRYNINTSFAKTSVGSVYIVSRFLLPSSTATTATAAMSSSRKRNFRRRSEDDDKEDEDKEKTTTPAATTTISKKQQSKPATATPKPKKPSLLSFDDDESTDFITPITRSRPSNPIKQPNSSRLSKPSPLSSSSAHKLTSAKDRNSAKERTSASSLPSNVQPQSGVYTKEALLELKKNTKTLGSSTSRSRPRPPPCEPIIVLKGMVKPIIDDSLTNTKEGDEESDRDETMNRLGSIRLGGKIGKGGNLDGGVIPDQAMIDAIRAKRERLRQSRAAAPDFRALDGGSNHGEAEGLSDDEPEFQGRIALIGEKGDAKKGVFEDVVDVSNATFRKENVGNDSDDGVEDEEDEEDKMWEKEQFRKCLGKRIDEGVAVRGVSSSTIPTIVQNVQQKVAYPTVPVSSSPSVNNGPSIGGSFGWSRFRYNINTSFAKTSVGSIYMVSRFLLPSSTATTATAAMSSSRKRNFRRRSEDDDKEDEDKEKTTTPAATTTISKKQQSKPATATPKPKKPSLLSFDDDESTDFITPITRSRPSNPIKQPSSSRLSKPSPLSSSSAHKLTSAKDRNSAKERTSASSLPSNVQPQADVYTKEALLELKKNTKTLGSSTSRSRPRPPPCEPIIVLKGMVKPIIDDSLTNTKEGDEESDRDETMNRLGSIRLDGKIGKGGNLDGGVIPDQAMIDAIRAKRERLRQSRATAPDFIALDRGSSHSEAEGLSDEEPEFHGRIALIGEKGDAKKGVFEDVVDVSNATYRKENVGNDSDDGVEDEEDEEDKMWEEEQFRKGLGKRTDEGVAVRGMSSSTIPTIVQNVQQKVAYPTVPVSSNPSVNNGPSIGGSFGWSRFRYNINTSFAKTSVGSVYIVSRFLLPSSTATTATAAMSSSRKRNFRRRSEDDDKEDEDKEKTTTPAATTTISKKQQSKPVTATPKPKKPSLLSFDDDESTDFITPITRSRPSNPIKQPSSSRLSKPSPLSSSSAHKLTSAKDRNSAKERTSASSLPSNVQPQAGVYTKEALLELKKNTKTLGSSTSRSRPRPPPCEPIIVLKGMVKPIIDDSLTNTKEGDEESDRDETINRLGSIRLGGKIGKWGNLDGGVIPDQAMIDAIRAKRERLRQSRAATPDFRALDGGSNHGEAEGLSDEEPKFQGRIALIGEKGDAKKGVFEDVVDVSNATFRKENVGNDSDDGVEDEEDEEDKMWEEEQFRKGLGKRIDEGVAVRGVSSSTIPTIVQNVQQKVAYPTVPVSSYPSVNNGPSIGGSFGWSRFRYNINTSFSKTSVGLVYIVSRFLLPSSTATIATAAMSSSRIRNFRRRSEDDDNEDEDKEKTTTPAATTTISKKQQSKPATATRKPKKPSLLSFADDESTDFITPITRSRPSNPFHNLVLPVYQNPHLSKERTSASSLPSNVQPQAGVYTKEALLELQKNTNTLGSSTSRSRPRPPPCEPIIVLKCMVKPIIDDSLTNTKEGDEESDRDETMNRLGSIRLGGKIGKGGNLDGGVIPDQAMIDAIREKRERLRQSRAAAPDFIALDGGSNHGEAEGLSDEEPEFQGRIALIGEKGDAKKGVFEDVVDVSNATFRKENVGNDSDDGVEDEEDEEDKMWEEEQFRKGLGKRIDEGVAVRGVSSSTIPTIVQNVQQKVAYPTVPVSSYPSVINGPSIGGSFGWSRFRYNINTSFAKTSVGSVYIVSRFLLPSSTATTATAAMSSSRKRNFRRRSEDDDKEDEDKEKTTTPAATTTISKKQQSKPATATPKPKKPSLLSFDDDESTDFITPITRSRPSNPIKQPGSSRLSKPSPLSSSSAHKLTSAKDRNSAKERTSASSLPSNVQPQAGVYTKEALLELKKNTKTLGSSTSRSRPRPPPCEPIIVLKGMVKPIIDDSLTNTKEGDEESDRDETMNRLGSIRLGGKIGKGGNLDGGVIPDQAMIDAIRAKRERLRQSRAAAPDFRALDGGSNHGEAEGLSDEEPEFQGRIALIGEKGDAKKGVFEDVVDVSNATFRKENVGNDSDDGVEDEEDEEDKMWEEEQFRKGLGKRIDEGIAVRGVSSSTIPTIVQNVQQKVAYPTVPVSSSPSVNNGPSIGGSFGWSRFRYNINTSFAKTSVGSVYMVSRFLLPSSTATTATAAMSSSRKRNFRRRSEDDDKEDEDKEKTTTPAATTTISKKQQSKPATATPKPKKPSLLSFDDDESTDFITPITRSRPSNPIKQPSSSRLSKPSPLSSSSAHKLTSAKDRNSAKERTSASSLPSNVQPQAGVYTKEALLELKKNTKTLGSSTSRSRPRPPPCEPIIVLKGMVKPIIDDSLTNTKEGDEESDRDETMNRLGSIRLGGKIGKGGNLDGGVIPDQAMIDAIRAKRERLRQSRAAAPDFRALDGGSNHGEAEGLSDEEPEFQGRIALIGEKGDAKKGVFEDVVDVSNATFRKENVGNDSDDGVEDEEDEEDKMWEEEQFRKGLGKRIDEGVAVRGVSSSTIPTIVQNVQQKVAYPTVPVSSSPSVNNGPSIGGSFGWSRFRYNINTSFAKTSVGSVYIVSRFLLPSSTATTATAAMSSSRIRNFRRRSEDDDIEDEDKEKTTTPAATTTISKKQQSKPATATPKPKKPSLLSFADDESTDFITPITRSRPSNPFHNLVLPVYQNPHLSKERTSASSLPSNGQPQAGVYTKEALLELQKNTKTLGSSTSRSRPRPPPCEPIIVLKGMVKPIIDDSLTNTKEGDEESDRDETMNRLGSIRLGGKIGKGGNLDGGVIPDQAMIDAIRAKRERLRQSRATAPDFIALDGGSNHSEAEGLSDEEPEFHGRIALIGEKGDAKKGVFEDVVDVSNATYRKENVGNDSDDGVEDEEDEEDKMWEEEQFRKGLGKRTDEGVAVRGVSSSTIPTIVQNVQQKVAYPTVPVSSNPSVNNGPSIGGSFGWSRFRYNINTSFAKTSVGSVYIVSRFLLPSSTATTATAAMSSSRIRNFRRRSEDDDNEDEDKEKTTTPAATTTTISKKQQSKPATTTPKPKKPSLLSFADDESTDFITPFTRSRPSNPIKQPSMVKPIIDDSLTNTKEGDEESYGDETMNRLGSIGLGGKIRKGGNLDGGVIPDQAMIDAIRAKRERLRQSRAAAPDFIALDGGSNHGEAEGLSDEEPEFQGRIALIGEKGDTKKGVFEDVVDVSNATFGKENVGNDSDDGVEDEEDEEDKMWEEEQFRKGLGKRIDEGVVVRGVSSSTIPTIVQNVQQKVAYPTFPVSSYPSVNNGPSIGGSFGWSSGSDTISISQQAELSKKALHDSVRRLKETHNRTLTSLTKTDENLADSLTKVTALENAYTAIDEKFRFMQKLHEYVSVICEFLQMLHKKRAEAIFERRAADSKDELMELEPSVNAAMVVINKGGNTNSIVESAGITAQVAQESRNLPVKLTSVDLLTKNVGCHTKVALPAADPYWLSLIATLRINTDANFQIDMLICPRAFIYKYMEPVEGLNITEPKINELLIEFYARSAKPQQEIWSCIPIKSIPRFRSMNLWIMKKKPHEVNPIYVDYELNSDGLITKDPWGVVVKITTNGVVKFGHIMMTDLYTLIPNHLIMLKKKIMAQKRNSEQDKRVVYDRICWYEAVRTKIITFHNFMLEHQAT